jgi:hypothetical protein
MELDAGLIDIQYEDVDPNCVLKRGFSFVMLGAEQASGCDPAPCKHLVHLPIYNKNNSSFSSASYLELCKYSNMHLTIAHHTPPYCLQIPSGHCTLALATSTLYSMATHNLSRPARISHYLRRPLIGQSSYHTLSSGCLAPSRHGFRVR